VYLYNKNKVTEREILLKVFSIAPQRVKYLGINNQRGKIIIFWRTIKY